MIVDSRLRGNDEHKLPAYSSYKDSGVEQQGEERANYGEWMIKQLSKDLSVEFGKGFSIANLRNFRQFYQTFPDVGKGYALRSELSLEKSYTVCSLLSEKSLFSDAKLSPMVRVLELGGTATIPPIMPSLAIPSFSAVIPAQAGIQNSREFTPNLWEGLQ